MSDVDDDGLGDLFRAAASDQSAPPPAFDHRTVVAASRRVTARRRAAATGLGVVLFAAIGVGTVVALPSGASGAGDASTVAAPMLAPAPVPAPVPGLAPEAAPGVAPDAAPRSAPDADSRAQAAPPAVPPGPAAAGVPEAAATGAAPLGPGTGECADRQDPALRAMVEQVLPEVVGAPEAATTDECRPGGERGVNVEIRDGAAAGLLTVQYLPPGTPAKVPAGGASATTASGGTVVLSSRADRSGGEAPLADRLQKAAAALAPHL